MEKLWRQLQLVFCLLPPGGSKDAVNQSSSIQWRRIPKFLLVKHNPGDEFQPDDAADATRTSPRFPTEKQAVKSTSCQNSVTSFLLC